MYERRKDDRVVGRWYVVKDLGATLGTTGRMDPKRNDIDAFEPHGFITGVRDGHVTFAFRGRHQELLRVITPDDVAWMCNRLARLTPAQWKDAFRAGGYDEARGGAVHPPDPAEDRRRAGAAAAQPEGERS